MSQLFSRPIIARLLPFLLLMALSCASDPEKPAEDKPPVEAPAPEAGPSTPPVSPDSPDEPETPEPSAPEPPRWQSFAEGIPLRGGKLYPVDQAAVNPEFLAFRDSLLVAIDRRDTTFLLRHVHQDVKVGIADPGGKENFRKAWGLDTDPRASSLWAELKEILALGGIFYDKELTSFAAPYVFHAVVDEPYEDLAITAASVRVRKQPGSAGEVIATLSYDIVKQAPIDWDKPEPVLSETLDGETHNWEKIITPTGDTGYVYGKYVRSMIDLRVHFDRTNKGWMMMSLLAGD